MLIQGLDLPRFSFPLEISAFHGCSTTEKENISSPTRNYDTKSYHNSGGVHPVLVGVPEADAKQLEHVEGSEDLLHQEEGDAVHRHLDVVPDLRGHSIIHGEQGG